MNQDIKLVKAENLALAIIRLYQFLTRHKNEFTISSQILRCGTSIGANIAESHFAESRSDFIHKLAISQKEANETLYWLRLLHKSGIMEDYDISVLYSQTEEILKILTSTIRTLKQSKKS